jgi:hypothetical protein
MLMNCMDYVNDSRYMFTAGQVARMHATLSGPRTSLLQSDVLTSPEEQAFVTDSKRLPEILYDGVEK